MIFKRFLNKNKKARPRKRAKRNNLGPSIVTAEVVIDGHLLSGGELQIDGEINGNVRAKAVVIDINGVVHGEVVAEDVIVRGRIIGPIRALHVHLLNGCHVDGDVLNETISIENGAYINGQIHRVDDPLGEDQSHQMNNAYNNSQQRSVYDYSSESSYEPNRPDFSNKD